MGRSLSSNTVKVKKNCRMVLREILGLLSDRIFCQPHIASVGKHSEAEVWSLTTGCRKITANCIMYAPQKTGAGESSELDSNPRGM